MRILPEYGKHFQWYWMLTPAAVVLLLFLFVLDAEMVKSGITANRSAIYGALVGLFGSLAGFSLASVALFLSLSGEGQMPRIKSCRHFGFVGSVFLVSIWSMAGATLVALGALIFDRKDDPIYWVAAAVAVSGVLALGSVPAVLWAVKGTIKFVAMSPGAD